MPYRLHAAAQAHSIHEIDLPRLDGTQAHLFVRRRDVWLFTQATASDLPSEAPGMRIRRLRSEILDGVVAEQGGRRGLRVIVYPYASIQSLV